MCKRMCVCALLTNNGEFIVLLSSHRTDIVHLKEPPEHVDFVMRCQLRTQAANPRWISEEDK